MDRCAVVLYSDRRRRRMVTDKRCSRTEWQMPVRGDERCTSLRRLTGLEWNGILEFGWIGF